MEFCQYEKKIKKERRSSKEKERKTKIQKCKIDRNAFICGEALVASSLQKPNRIFDFHSMYMYIATRVLCEVQSLISFAS